LKVLHVVDTPEVVVDIAADKQEVVPRKMLQKETRKLKFIS
jgi:hypothetical protein